MPHSPEYPEQKPEIRHHIHIESEDNGLILERNKWLGRAFEVDGPAVIDAGVSRDLLQAMAQWGKELPYNYQEVIQKMRNKRWQEKFGGTTSLCPLPVLIKDAFKNNDQAALGNYQAFGKDLIRRYRGNPEQFSWDDLSEQHKLFVRLGEMTILAVDSLKVKAQSEIDREPEKAARFAKLAIIMDKYCQSRDVPTRFKEKYAYPIIRSVTGQDPRMIEFMRQEKRSQERRRQFEGATINDLWGRSAEEQTPSRNQETKIETVSGGVASGSENAAVKNKDEEVVDVEYSPESGSFESVEDNDKSRTESFPKA